MFSLNPQIGVYLYSNVDGCISLMYKINLNQITEGFRMGRSDKISLWYVSFLINTRFRFFILE